ncbi:MAG: hypothetical protein HKN80_07240 [Acidimicrobiia bacterium]|nr:HEAT repeat domain-containing protein [Acidimicrobiia bacterium]NNC92273.1 hypothetical protein [Acidimicrobiia bacterium]
MTADALSDTLRQTGLRHGLVGFGVCSVEPFGAVRSEMGRRIELGLAGRPRFTYTDPVVATEVSRSFPWAERLIVGSVAYLPAAGTPGPAAPDTGRVARFATVDHYQPLRTGLIAVARQLEESGHRSEVLADDNRLVDRAAAVRAGVAWWGKSTMALAPGFGPWLLLGSVVTDAVLPVSTPMVRDCGTCVACIPACPTGALDEEGVLDATRCISYWAQTPGFIPRDIRRAWGDRLYGCDDCLEACPPGGRLAEGAGSMNGRIDLVELLERSDEELMDTYAHFYVPRRDARFLRRNALVALGHNGTRRAIPVLIRYLESPIAVLRGHAAWALGRIGGKDGRVALERARSIETDPTVVDELEAAARLSEGR